MANCLSCTAPVVPPPLYQDIGLGDPRPHWGLELRPGLGLGIGIGIGIVLESLSTRIQCGGSLNPPTPAL